MPGFNAPARIYLLKQRRLLTVWPLVELVKIQKAIFMHSGKVVFISICLKKTHFSSFLFECLIQNSYLFCLPKSTFSANQYFCSAFWKLSKSIKIFIFGKQTKRSTTVHEKSHCWKKKLFIEKNHWKILTSSHLQCFKNKNPPFKQLCTVRSVYRDMSTVAPPFQLL